MPDGIKQGNNCFNEKQVSHTSLPKASPASVNKFIILQAFIESKMYFVLKALSLVLKTI